MDRYLHGVFPIVTYVSPYDPVRTHLVGDTIDVRWIETSVAVTERARHEIRIWNALLRRGERRGQLRGHQGSSRAVQAVGLDLNRDNEDVELPSRQHAFIETLLGRLPCRDGRGIRLRHQ